MLDLVTRLEARVFDRPSGTTAEDRTALLLAGLAAAFVSFAGVATLVAGGLAEPGAVGGTAVTEVGIVTIAVADGVAAAVIGFRLASTRLAGARAAPGPVASPRVDDPAPQCYKRCSHPIGAAATACLPPEPTADPPRPKGRSAP